MDTALPFIFAISMAWERHIYGVGRKFATVQYERM
jgi:hypothetical protein